MGKVAMSTHLPIPAEDVWTMVGKFNALPDWHPGVASSRLEDGGRVRRMQLFGGGELVERLEQQDDEGHVYRYTVVSGPLPVANCTSEIRVMESEQGGCTVEWSCDFVADGAPEADATRAVREIYKAGFDNLRKIYGL